MNEVYIDRIIQKYSHQKQPYILVKGSKEDTRIALDDLAVCKVYLSCALNTAVPISSVAIQHNTHILHPTFIVAVYSP